jgi:hypothetical protein
MTWDALGAIGELLGSVLVLITLIYLAIQTRGINKQAKARYAFVDTVAQFNMNIAANSVNSSVWRRGLSCADELHPDGQMQFFMIVGQ